MATNNDEQMRQELHELFVTARTCELTTADFAARLESVHARFLGSAAQTSDLLKRRRNAATVYDDLLAGTDMDRHHHLELLAEALDLSPTP